MSRPLPSISFVQECFDLDPSVPSGLRWRRRPREHFANTNAWAVWNSKHSGKPAGSPDTNGYPQVGLTFGGNRPQIILAHRVVFALAHDRWPTMGLDHVHGLQAGNGAENLREATKSQNSQNASKRRDNRSGFTGVSWRKASRKWIAQIQIAGKKLYLGSFDTPETAYVAFLAGKAMHHTFQPTLRASP